MKILLVAHERNMGGASKSLVTLCSELAGKGNDVHVILPFGKGSVREALSAQGIPYKVIFFGWWMEPSYWNGLMKLAFRFLHAMEGIAVQRICRYAKKIGAQVIHSNSSVIDVGAKAAMKMRLPHVWHVREFGDLDYRLVFMNGREKACQYMAQTPGRILFISQSLRAYYKEIPDEVCEVVYNGISESYLYKKSYVMDTMSTKADVSGETAGSDCKEKASCCTFLIAANLQRAKRQDLAIRACLRLMELGELGFKLVIAGAPSALADSKEYEKELKQLAAPLGERVLFTGAVKEMLPLRQTSDVELVLSDSEAFGRVTVEAMMASNPVIATAGGANGELVRHKYNGIIICANENDEANEETSSVEKVNKNASDEVNSDEKNDNDVILKNCAEMPHNGIVDNSCKPCKQRGDEMSDSQAQIIALADAMRYLMKHPEEIRRMGKNAYAFAKEKFPSKKNTDSMHKIYQDLTK